MLLHVKRQENSRRRVKKRARKRINATCISFVRVVRLILFIYFCHRDLIFSSVILPSSPAAETLSSTEVQKRADSYDARRTLLKSNPSLYVSKTRLSIRQIPTFVTERMLKRLATHAIQAFEEEVVAGSRKGLSEEELAPDEPAPDEDKIRAKRKPIPRVRQAKIVRQADRVDPLTGKGRSKGYGFLELREHADALRVLRWANNNPEVPPLFVAWWSAELAEEKKHADSAQANKITEAENRGTNAKQQPTKGMLIVEFSIENAQVVQRRSARQKTVSF
jgi:nucleolar protein 4